MKRELANLEESVQALGDGRWFTAIHASHPWSFENVMGRLGDLGVRAGTPSLDRGTRPFLRWLRRGEQQDVWSMLPRTIVASGARVDILDARAGEGLPSAARVTLAL